MATIKNNNIVAKNTLIVLNKDVETFSGTVLKGTVYKVSGVGERGYDLTPVSNSDPVITEFGFTGFVFYDPAYHGPIIKNGMISKLENLPT